MYQHISEYVLDSNTVFTEGYLCNCEEYIHMNFFCLKESREADMSKTGRKVNMTIKTELDAENDRELDGVIDKAVVFEFTDMSSYVAGITFFFKQTSLHN